MFAPSRVILVVEADEDLQRLFAALVADEGYEAQIVTSVPAAAQALRVSQPALVLLDMDSVGNQGGEFIKDARARFGKSLPIVIVGPRYEAAAMAEAVQADASLAKPFDIGSFSYLIHALTKDGSEKP